VSSGWTCPRSGSKELAGPPSIRLYGTQTRNPSAWPLTRSEAKSTSSQDLEVDYAGEFDVAPITTTCRCRPGRPAVMPVRRTAATGN
jgi:hypothetical protein